MNAARSVRLQTGLFVCVGTNHAGERERTCALPVCEAYTITSGAPFVVISPPLS